MNRIQGALNETRSDLGAMPAGGKQSYPIASDAVTLGPIESDNSRSNLTYIVFFAIESDRSLHDQTSRRRKEPEGTESFPKLLDETIYLN